MQQSIPFICKLLYWDREHFSQILSLLQFPKNNIFIAKTTSLKTTAGTHELRIEGRFRNDNWHEGERSVPFRRASDRIS